MVICEDMYATLGSLHREGHGIISEFPHPSLTSIPPLNYAKSSLPCHHSTTGQSGTIPFLKVDSPPREVPRLSLGELSQKNGALEEGEEYLTVPN